MKRVLVFASGADTGGQGERIRQAFAKHVPDWQIDSLAAGRNPFGYPQQFTDHQAHTRLRRAMELADSADVLHLRLSLGAWEKLDRSRHKPTVLHHHGTIFRSTHFALSEWARRIGAVQIASTVDLTLLEPDVQWLPSPFDLGALRAIRERIYQPSERVRIAHAPTNRTVKSTHVFEAAVKRLQREYALDVDIIEGVPWAQCLERKAEADIFYDQVGLGYGNNAIEAWGMGIPVVAGVSDPSVRARMLSTWGAIPWVDATPATLEDTLRRLIESPAMRAEHAHLGSAFVARFHDDAVVAAKLRDIYASAPATRSAQRPMPLSGRERRLAMAGAA